MPYAGAYFFENPTEPGTAEPMPVFRPGIRIGDYRPNAQIPYNADHAPVVTTPDERHDAFRARAFAERLRLGLGTDPVHASEGRIRAKQWKLADWEGHGDLDLLIGIGDWADYGWDDAFDVAGRWTNGPLHGSVYLALRKTDGSYAEPRKLTAAEARWTSTACPVPTWPISIPTET